MTRRSRLLAGLALALLASNTVAGSAPAGAMFIGHVRSVRGTATLRGLDGHLFRLTFEARNSWAMSGDSSDLQLWMTVVECVGRRCGAPVRFVRDLTTAGYSERQDLSYTRVAAPYGRLLLILQFESGPGWGKLPPTTDTSDGVRAVAAQSGRFTLLAGLNVDNSLTRFVRCVDERAVMSNTLRASTEDDEFLKPNWPLTEPPGLAVKVSGARHFTCV